MTPPAQGSPATIMPLDAIPDWDRRLARQDAFWDCRILDRPVVAMVAHTPRPGAGRPPRRTYADDEECWLDFEAVAAHYAEGAAHCTFLGDALPHAWPNFGPDVFAALFGARLRFGRDTSWSEPCLHDWAAADDLALQENGLYWRRLEALTDALLAAGRGRFYVGLTDLHPGGDALAAFRDPQNLALDLLDHPDEVKALLARVTQAYFRVFTHFQDRLSAAGQPGCNWTGIVSTRRWYVPSNDFSCMISKEQFDEFFLPGIREECRFLERSIYHLDGPGALRHLDSLLEIPELQAIQWVYGAGHGRASDWLHVYRRCQQAGKAIQLGIAPDEIGAITEALAPEGVWLSVGGVDTPSTGEAILRRLAGWTRRGTAR